MKPSRLLALDLDNTLLRSELSASHRTRSAIKGAEETGLKVVLVSERLPESMEHVSLLLGLHKTPGYLICNNGALILESHTENIVHEERLPAKTALAICDLADSEGFAMQMYDNDLMYVSKKNEFSDYDEQISGLRQVVVENFRAMVGEGCYKLIIPGQPEYLCHVKTIIQTFLGDDISIYNSRSCFLEIMSRGTSKTSALTKITEIMGIRTEEIMAIGDFVCDKALVISNIGDGVAVIIEKYFQQSGSK